MVFIKNWLLVYWVHFHAVIVFFIFIFQGILNYSIVNDAVRGSGINIPAVEVLLGIWTLNLFYAIFLVIKSFKTRRKHLKFVPNWFNKIFPIFNILLLSTLLLGTRFISNIFIGGMYRTLKFVTVILIIEITILLFIFIPNITKYLSTLFNKMKNQEKSDKRAILMISLVLCFMLGTIILPYIEIPGNVIDDELPKKPEFIAHRGGAFIGPENTLEVAPIAREYGAIGWEIDIRISKDGFPFLLHDNNFYRTTNIQEIFPERINERAESFTIDEILQLNAGEYFFDEPNSLWAKKNLDETRIKSYRESMIPTLEDAIKITEEYGWIMDPDMKSPPSDHPFASEFEDIIIEMLMNSNIPNILLTERTHVSHPNITHVASSMTLNPNELKEQGYQMAKVRDLRISNEIITQYYGEGIEIYINVLNDPIGFSEFWCIGADYVMTDAPHIYNSLNRPIWSVNKKYWYTGWTLFNIGLIIWLRYNMKKNNNEKEGKK